MAAVKEKLAVDLAVCFFCGHLGEIPQMTRLGGVMQDSIYKDEYAHKDCIEGDFRRGEE